MIFNQTRISKHHLRAVTGAQQFVNKVHDGSSYLNDKKDEIFTPPKFKMEPEKKSLEKDVPLEKPSVSCFMLNFGGVHHKQICSCAD